MKYFSWLQLSLWRTEETLQWSPSVIYEEIVNYRSSRSGIFDWQIWRIMKNIFLFPNGAGGHWETRLFSKTHHWAISELSALTSLILQSPAWPDLLFSLQLLSYWWYWLGAMLLLIVFTFRPGVSCSTITALIWHLNSSCWTDYHRCPILVVIWKTDRS